MPNLPASTPTKQILSMPRLGLGTWHMGERENSKRSEVAALRLAIELGYRLIDTAEMYGDGGSEKLIGQALADAFAAGDVEREQMFIVSKVYPHNASRKGVAEACASSLDRVGLDYLDLYLLHWPGQHPLAETVAGFEALCKQGRIRRWGVSNFDTADMLELWSVPGGTECAVNQIYFSLSERGASFSLLPWMRERGVGAMAYSPIDQGALAAEASLQVIAKRHGVSAAQLALAWVLAQDGVAAIPKAVQAEHLRENLAAAQLALDRSDLLELDGLFPPPRRKQPLAMI